jgi:hypothetical protein
VTRGDWAQCEAVFAPDAIWEAPTLALRYESRESFIETLKATTFETLIQTPHSPVVRLTSVDRAEATTTIHEMSRGVTAMGSELAATGEQLNVDMYGIYHDDVARIDGKWKFTHRLFVPFYMTNGSVTGDVLTPRSGLLRSD